MCFAFFFLWLYTHDKRTTQRAQHRQQLSPIGKLPPDFGEWFEIKETVLGGNTMKGVFAKRTIPKTMFLGEYRGKVSFGKPDKDFSHLPHAADYVVAMKARKGRTKFIDGQDPNKSSWLRLINTAPAGASPGKRNNAEFVEQQVGQTHKVFVQSLRTIGRGSQVFIKYKLRGQ